jgi:hypothetical protein
MLDKFKRGTWLAGGCIAIQAAVWAQAQPTVRPEIAAAMAEVQAALIAGDWGQAQRKLDSARTRLTPVAYEAYALQRMALAIALGQKDRKSAEAAYEKASEAAADPSWMTAADHMAAAQVMVQLSFGEKDYPATIKWSELHQARGGRDPVVSNMWANALYRSGNYKQAASLLSAAVELDTKAGKVPPNASLEVLAQCQEKLKNDAGYAQALELLVQHYPKKPYWQALLARQWNRTNLPAWGQIELARLNLRTDTLMEATDYLEFAEMSVKAGYPAEAVRVLERGLAQGALGKGPDATKHQQLRAQAQQLHEQDRLQIDEEVKKATQTGDANAMGSLGQNLVLSGQADKGIALLEQAIAKGVTRRPEQVKLNLVSARVQTGQLEEARRVQASMDANGVGAELARLWLWTRAGS